MRTHIPDGTGKTYCGRTVGLTVARPDSVVSGHVTPPPGTVVAIDLRVVVIDEATCCACHRSDDRRVREQYERDYPNGEE